MSRENGLKNRDCGWVTGTAAKPPSLLPAAFPALSWLTEPVAPPAVRPEVRLLAWERLLRREEGTEAGGRLQKVAMLTNNGA